MGRRPKIVKWINLRDKILTRIAIEENPAVLHDLLTCYQQVIKIKENEKALNKNKPKPVKLARPTS